MEWQTTSPNVSQVPVSQGQNLRFIALTFAVMVVMACPSAAVDVHETVEPSHFSYFKNPYWELLVIEVLSVEDENATNADPPSGDVRVLEVLRGRVTEGVHRAIWHSPAGSDDYESDTSGNLRLRQSWKEREAKGPAVGDQLIVVAGRDPSTGILGMGDRVYRMSPTNRETVLREMGPPERPASIQIPIFLVLLGLPMIGMTLLGSGQRLQALGRRPLRRIVASIPVVELVLFLYYEAGFSTYSNIRIDLLFVWPAILTSLSLWFLLWLKRAT